MKSISLGLLLGLVPAIAFAALSPEADKHKVGDFEVSPKLKASIASNDNVYKEQAGEDSALVYTVNPSVKARLGDDEKFNELTASLTDGFFDASAPGDDKFIDYSLGYNGGLPLMANVKLTGNVGIEQAHEGRGDALATDDCYVGVAPVPLPGGVAACSALPNFSRTNKAEVKVEVGGVGAKGKLEGTLGGDNKRYINNVTNTDPKEANALNLKLKFSWQVAPKSNFVVDFKHDENDYVHVIRGNNQGDRFTLGYKWDKTAVTSGSIKLGKQHKNVEKVGGHDVDEMAWDIGVTWEPTTIDSIRFNASNDFDNAANYADPATPLIIATVKSTQKISLKGSHKIGDRVEPYAEISNSKDDYKGTIRKDDKNTYVLGVGYKFRKNVVFDASYTAVKLTSSIKDAGTGVPTMDFDQGVFLLSADVAL